MEGMSCFNGGGFIFKWGGGGRCPMWGIGFGGGGVSKKIVRWGGPPPPPPPPLPTMGNPGKYTSYVLALPAPSVKTG